MFDQHARTTYYYNTTDALLLLLSVLQLWDHECDLQLDDQEPHIPTKKTNVVWELPAGFKHYTLARLTILGFYDTGSQGIVAFLRSMMQAAVHLEEIHICEKAPCDECELTKTGSFPRTDHDKDALRERISGGRSTAFKIYIQPCILTNDH